MAIPRAPRARAAIVDRMRGKWSETVVLAVLLTTGILVLSSVAAYPAGSWEYPTVLAGLIVLIACWRMAELVREPSFSRAAEQANVDEADDSPREDLSARATATYATIVTAMVLSLYALWFPISAFIGGAAILKLVFGWSWIRAAVAAALVSLGSSALFYCLDVPLPGMGG